MKTNTFTKKIELRINITNEEDRLNAIKKLFRIRDLCVGGANTVMSHLWYQVMSSSIIYQRNKEDLILKGLDIKDPLVKKKLNNDTNTEMSETFVLNKKTNKPISPQNTTYQVLSFMLKGQVPGGTLTALNSVLVSNFNSIKGGLLRNERSLSNYKSDMPIPFQSAMIMNIRKETVTYYSNNKKIRKDNGKSAIVPETVEKKAPTIAFTLFDIPFQMFFGRDKSGQRTTIEQALSEWFLPGWVSRDEESLSNAILASTEDTFTGRLEGPNRPPIEYVFYKIQDDEEEEKDDNTEEDVLAEEDKGKKPKFFYKVQTHTEEGEIIEFLMQACVRKTKKAWQIVSNYKLCDSTISIEKRPSDVVQGKNFKQKVFLNAVIKCPKVKKELDPMRMATCRLDPHNPVVISYNGKDFKLGEYGGIIYRRQSFQSIYRDNQRMWKGMRHGGKGRKRKLWTLNTLHRNERNYCKTKAHEISAAVIKFCLANKIKHLHLTGVLEAFAGLDPRDDKYKFLIRNWGWGGLSTFLDQKTQKWDIELTRDKDLKEKVGAELSDPAEI